MEIGLITINYNSSYHTINLIRSFLSSKTVYRCQLFIVDNSPDGSSLEVILAEFKEIINVVDEPASFRAKSDNKAVYLWRSHENLGFARANNVAFKILNNCDFTIVINNDVVFGETYINTLVNFTRENDLWCSSSVLLHGSTEKVWYAGGKNSIEPFFRSRHLGVGKDRKLFSGSVKCDFASGALFCLNNSLFREKYIFNEHFFFGEEDSEFFLRMKRQSYGDVVVNMDLHAYHMIGQSRELKNSFWRISQAINSKTKLFLVYTESRFMGVALSTCYIFALMFIIIPIRYRGMISHSEYVDLFKYSIISVWSLFKNADNIQSNPDLFSEKILGKC